MSKKQFAGLGLGRFGGNLVKEFHELGTEVLAVDKEIDKVNEFSPLATAAVQANVTDETNLKTLGYS